MTVKRKCVLGAILASIACAVLVTLACLPTRPGVTRANFDRIQDGMAREDVDGILGECFPISLPESIVPMVDGAPVEYRVWVGDDGQAVIGFSRSRVYEKNWTETPRSWSDKIHQWLHLP